MSTAVIALLTALAGFTLYFIGAWWQGASAARRNPAAPPAANETGGPPASGLMLGFVTNFFDALGIGSFAPTTAVFKFLQMVPDRIIPGTLNVGHTLPTIAQAFISIATIEVETVYAEARPGGPLDITVKVNGEVVASGQVPISAPLLFTANDCLDIGTCLGSPVSLDYFDRAPFPFNGSIDNVNVRYLS